MKGKNCIMRTAENLSLMELPQSSQATVTDCPCALRPAPKPGLKARTDLFIPTTITMYPKCTGDTELELHSG